MFFEDNKKYIQDELDVKHNLLIEADKLFTNASVENCRYGHGQILSIDRVDDLHTTNYPYDCELVATIQFDDSTTKPFALTHDSVEFDQTHFTDSEKQKQFVDFLDKAVKEYNSTYSSILSKIKKDRKEEAEKTKEDK